MFSATRWTVLSISDWFDLDFFGFGSLNLKRFVDQVAQDLFAQPVDLARRDLAAIGNRQKASRWSTSVWVMTSPLTIAVALTTEGMALPEYLGVLRQLQATGAVHRCLLIAARPVPLLRERRRSPVPSAGTAAGDQRARRDSIEKMTATIGYSLSFHVIALAAGPLNAGLAAEPLQRQVNGEGAALAEGADALIVAAPRQAKLQAFVFIFDAETVANRLKPSASENGSSLLSVRSMTVAPKTDQ